MRRCSADQRANATAATLQKRSRKMADRGAAASASAQAKARWDAYKREQERRAREDSAERETARTCRGGAPAPHRVGPKEIGSSKILQTQLKSVQNGGDNQRRDQRHWCAAEASESRVITQGVFTPICTAPADSAEAFSKPCCEHRGTADGGCGNARPLDFSRGVQSVREHKRPKNRSGAQSAKTLRRI